MYSILSFAGERVEAVILSVEPNCIRIALQGEEDAQILRQSGGRWRTESGDLVEFESLLAGDQTSAGTSTKYLVTSERYQARTANVAQCVSSSCSPKQTRHSRPRTVLNVRVACASSTGAGMD